MKRSKYTVRNETAVDAFVEGQLALVTDGVRKLMGDELVAILLGGGFGRGEGGVKVGPGDEIRIVNDYDLEVVYRERYGAALSKLLILMRKRKKLEALAESLAHTLGVKQVDLSLRGESSFSGVTAPRLCDYDLKYGHIVLEGVDSTERMPLFQPSDIPKFEGTWLLRNRGIGLLLARFYLDADKKVIAGKNEYYNIELNKAFLAMGDALFIGNGRYHPSYAKRKEMIRSVIPEDTWWGEELASLYTLAAEFKLYPTLDFEFPEPPAKMWEKIAFMFLAVFLHYEGARIGTEMNSLGDYAAFVRNKPKNAMKIKGRLMVDRLLGRIESDMPGLAYLKRDKLANILFAMLLISLAVDDGARVEHANLLGELGAEVGPEGVGEDSWYAFARELLLVSHPQGELGRMLKKKR